MAARPVPEPGADLLIVHHTGGKALQLSFVHVVGAEPGAALISHTFQGTPGDSGAPCFDVDLNLVALFTQTGVSTLMSAVVDDLRRRGLVALLTTTLV